MNQQFSQNLIKEYQKEMEISYGVSVAESEAQIQLLALVNSMFPVSSNGLKVVSRVGDSITPTSGQLSHFNYL